MSLVKWARENGACHIKVDGVELTFPPDFAPSGLTPLSPEDIVRRAAATEFNPNAPNAVKSQHPDSFAEQSDRWAAWMPDAG